MNSQLFQNGCQPMYWIPFLKEANLFTYMYINTKFHCQRKFILILHFSKPDDLAKYHEELSPIQYVIILHCQNRLTRAHAYVVALGHRNAVIFK